MKWIQEKRLIKDLYVYKKNPRILSKEQADNLYKSIDKFGQCEPIVINTDGFIIGGHQRFRTMQKMGEKTVDVCVPDSTLNQKEVEELNIRLNKNVGDWDYDILANSWDVFELLNWGFTENELLDSVEEVEEKSKKISITIKIIDEEQLSSIEKKINMILSEYEGATYKIKK